MLWSRWKMDKVYGFRGNRQRDGGAGRLVWFCRYGLAGLALLLSVYASAQSVLRTGTWVKIGITQTGPYRLSYEAISAIQPAFANADPRRFRLYGNGGAPLPQANSTPRPADLTENAILVEGEADGRFDRGDALLFWGEGPHVIRQDSATGRLSHTINPYSDTTFYFLTVADQPGRRMAMRAPGDGTGLPAVSSFAHYRFHELEQTSRVRSGREWLGEFFGITTEQTFAFDIPGLVTNSPIEITSSVVADAPATTQFTLRLNSLSLGTQSVEALSGYRYDRKGIENRRLFSATAGTDPNLRVTLSYDRAGQSSAAAYLNFLGVQTRRELRLYDTPTLAWLSPGRYTVRQVTGGLRVWDVSLPTAPVSQSVTPTGPDGTWASASQGRYVLFADNQFRQPLTLALVPNQNVRAEATPQLLIVTPAAFRAEAERLASFRQTNDGLTTLVVTTQQLYNEFASGQPDPTAIRDAARYFDRKAPGTLRYLLLFGDATFDYRNLSGILNPAQWANTVPVYESRESLHPVLSYSSDDYFGFLQENAGEWPETNAGDLRLDIGIGRLPVKTPDEARTVVDKLIRYATDRSLAGDWQTRVAFVADDGDSNIHQNDADQLARDIERKTPFRPQRIFLDDFVQESAPGGQRAPGVNQTISRIIDEGRLIINYTGHGGETGWAEEQVLTLNDIFTWRNRRLPLLVTATCEFGRYDDPNVNSGAELALLSRQGGAIGLLTTTRPVYANTNFLLNEAFYQAVFKPVNGQMPRLGDVFRETKNNSLSGSLNRNFALIADPSMRLAYPQADVALTHVNGRAVKAGAPDTLRALQSVVLEGEIQQPATRQRMSDFNGRVRLTLYDKPLSRTTRGTESSPMNYQTYASLIFSGQVAVNQGRFRVQFVVPKDIDYSFGQGRLYAYALRADSLFDAIGQAASLVIGSTAANPVVDTQPPSLTLAVIGGTPDGSDRVRVAGPDVTLRIQVADNLGINLAQTGLGHELTAQLNTDAPIVLNSNYVSEDSEGRRGSASVTFRNLPSGSYTVRAKAWDVNNNSTEGALTFIVSEKPSLLIRSLWASPNPVVDQTQLALNHNRPGETLDWSVQVYDQAGRLLSEQVGQCDSCPETVSLGQWDGRNGAGSLLINGLYLYRVVLRAASDGSEAKAGNRILLVR
ncbi:type IX secretion system sortase PorU [Rudanella paleaurantiibacter]|uniref:type IX secretion system sortase PorU n=1 Tax=Rudanella paleaurantiibacter TaxID=2614655 RepID=UPI001FEC1A37|nr:type IX secretion system sortase PorU [Rudanella paleaurantiibacter]